MAFPLLSHITPRESPTFATINCFFSIKAMRAVVPIKKLDQGKILPYLQLNKSNLFALPAMFIFFLAASNRSLSVANTSSVSNLL